MPTIHLTTFIQAPVERVFDLSRSVSFHQLSMKANGEKAIAGKMEGLLNLNETVTWQAKHLLKTRILTTQISAFEMHRSFTDEMVKGDFKSIRHEHHFKVASNGTIMIDLFYYEVPYGLPGKIFDTIYLRNYMKKLLTQRNAVIKNYAESNKWKLVLS